MSTTGYRVKGTTGDVTQCDRCGKDDLRKTVALAILDEDGNEEEIVHYGVDCAARVTRRPQKVIRTEAASYDYRTEQAARWARETFDYYGTVPLEAAAARYAAANSAAIERFGGDPAAMVTDLLGEIRIVVSGELAGTRWAG